MDPTQFQKDIDALRREIEERYGIAGRTLGVQVRKLGRSLPKYERGQARVLAEAETALGHPKMAMRIQVQAFEHAKTALQMHLETVSPTDRRKGRAIDIAATVLVNVFLAAVVLAVIWAVISAN